MINGNVSFSAIGVLKQRAFRSPRSRSRSAGCPSAR